MNFSLAHEYNYFTNFQELFRHIYPAQKFFEKYFSKEEIDKIREDPEYYFQDERFIHTMKLFKPKDLIDKLNEEEKLISIRY